MLKEEKNLHGANWAKALDGLFANGRFAQEFLALILQKISRVTFWRLSINY